MFAFYSAKAIFSPDVQHCAYIHVESDVTYGTLWENGKHQQTHHSQAKRINQKCSARDVIPVTGSVELAGNFYDTLLRIGARV
jgi:hypothetical protein